MGWPKNLMAEVKVDACGMVKLCDKVCVSRMLASSSK